jgi:hypothetical protein
VGGNATQQINCFNGLSYAARTNLLINFFTCLIVLLVCHCATPPHNKQDIVVFDGSSHAAGVGSWIIFVVVAGLLVTHMIIN